MIIRYIAYSLAWVICAFAGIFGGYHLARYAHIGESIWGNDVDGWGGDSNYKNKQAKVWYRKLWADWWWSCIRNPANNLLRNKLCAEGTILSVERKGYLTVITMDDDSQWFFYYNEGSKYVVKFGWRFWSDQIKEGTYYKASFVLNP